MALQWVAVDARTGVQLAELPSLTVDGVLKATIGRYETATVSLPIAPGAAAPPPNWLRATLPWAAALVALNEENRPVWGGYITQRERNDGDVVSLSLASAESYLDRRYVGDVTYSAVGQNAIVAGLVARYVVDGAGGRPGIPLRVQVTTPGLGVVRDRSYYDKDDSKVYARLQQLAGVLGGPEWSIGWEWRLDDPAQPKLTPVLFVGDRIGTAAGTGLDPGATFSLPGSVISASLVEDYSDGKGANDVTAVSSGEGEARPTSGPVRSASFGDRPTLEFRWTPGSSISSVSVLVGHARAALAILGNGATALILTAATQGAPRLGTDWHLGDDVGHEIGDDDVAPAFPGGLSGAGRAIGWEYDSNAETVSPILAIAELATEAT